MIRAIPLLAMVPLIVTALCALDVRDGLARGKIDELNGRVTLYRLAAMKGTQYEPLVFDTDARGRSRAAAIGRGILKLGDTQECSPRNGEARGMRTKP